MQNAAADVDADLADVPDERRPAFSALRALCRSALPGYEETMTYGMPSDVRDGIVEVAWASQKRHISLYVKKAAVVDAFREDLSVTGAGIGKGCIRYARPEKIDLALVERLLRAMAVSPAEVC